jgi:hypothetical protein
MAATFAHTTVKTSTEVSDIRSPAPQGASEQGGYQDHPPVFAQGGRRVIGILFVVGFAVLGELAVPDDGESGIQCILTGEW